MVQGPLDLRFIEVHFFWVRCWVRRAGRAEQIVSDPLDLQLYSFWLAATAKNICCQMGQKFCHWTKKYSCGLNLELNTCVNNEKCPFLETLHSHERLKFNQISSKLFRIYFLISLWKYFSTPSPFKRDKRVCTYVFSLLVLKATPVWVVQ